MIELLQIAKISDVKKEKSAENALYLILAGASG